MKVEPKAPQPPLRDVEIASLRPQAIDTIISPYAPIWPSKIVNFISWLFDLIRPFLPFSSKDQPLQISPPSCKRAIQTVEKEHQKPSPVVAAANQAIFPALISWWQNDSSIFATYAAKTAFEATSYSIESLAKSLFPAVGSSPYQKEASILVAAPLIWCLSDHLGFPQGKLYQLSISISFLTLFLQARAVALQKTEGHLRKALAG